MSIRNSHAHPFLYSLPLYAPIRGYRLTLLYGWQLNVYRRSCALTGGLINEVKYILRIQM